MEYKISGTLRLYLDNNRRGQKPDLRATGSLSKLQDNFQELEKSLINPSGDLWAIKVTGMQS
jgi:hypothetical protein